MMQPHLIPPTLLFALTVPLAAAVQSGTQQVRVLEVVPIADLLFRAAPPRAPRLGPLTRRKAEQETPPRLLTGAQFFCVQQDQFLELVRSTCGDIANEVSMIVRGQSLLVSGSAEHVARVEQIVTTMRRAMTQRFAVNARLYRITGGVYPAAATARRLEELTKDLTLVWQGHSKTLSGQQVALAQENFSRYVSDVTVEVAEEVSVARPITSSMFAGIRVLIESHSLIGTTDRVFKCQFALGEKSEETELQSTGVQGMPSIGIPHLVAISGAFSGRVEHDGALLVTIASRAQTEGNFLLVVRAGPSGSDSTEVSAGRTLLLPVSALTSHSMQFDMPFADVETDPEGTYGGYPELDVAMEDGSDRGDTLLSVLRERLGSLLDAEDSGIDMTSNGPGRGFILVRGSEKARTEARRQLIALQDEWLQTIETNLSTELVAVPPGGSTFSALNRIDPAPRSVLHRVVFPTLVGDTAVIFKGVESSVVRDYEPEIATKTTLSRPVVQTTFRGMFAGVRPTMLGRAIDAELHVEINHIPPALRQSTTQDSVGDLYHVSVNKAEFTHAGPVELDKVSPLGWGPRFRVEPHDLRMHQSVRFRKL